MNTNLNLTFKGATELWQALESVARGPTLGGATSVTISSNLYVVRTQEGVTITNDGSLAMSLEDHHSPIEIDDVPEFDVDWLE